MQATIQGVHFDEWPRNYDESFVIAPQGLEGWLEGTEARRLETPRPGAHGSFDAPVYRAARTISISGSVLASSEAVLNEMIDQLLGILVEGGSSRLVVQDDRARITWAQVRIAGAPSVTRHVGHTADFQIQFWAPDPRRYGDLHTFPLGELAYHYGNAKAWPVVVIPQAPSSYDITSAGNVFRVAGAPSGGTHRVDMRTGRLTRNGSLVVGAVTRSETWPVGAGKSVTFSAPAGSTVEVHDTYM